MGFWPKKKTKRATRQEKQRKARVKRHILLGGISLSVIGAIGYATFTGAFARAHDYAENKIVKMTAEAGFHVRDVLVTGRHNIPQDTLFHKLQITQNDPIFNLPIGDIQDRIAEMSWVEEVSVSRRLPDKVIIHITERRPVALWQYKQKVSLIDIKGHVLATDDLGTWEHLPLLVGAHAADNATHILSLLYAEPEIAQQLSSAVRIGARRWDLHMANGMVVKLPENNVELALRQLTKQQKEHQIFDKNITIVDLRIPDKLVVRTPSKNDKT